MTDIDTDASEMQRAVYAANRAAFGDSNDTEIEALRDALELALTRWPEIDASEGAEQ